MKRTGRSPNSNISTFSGDGMKRYRCLPHTRMERGLYAIVPVQPEHIESIRCWRNAQIDVLRQPAPVTAAEQERYYAVHIWPDMEAPHPANLLFSYFLGDRVIGYGGLVHIAWEHRRAEVSFLLDPARNQDLAQYRADYGTFLSLMRELAFADLGLHRLHAETYAMRERQIAILEESGFRREGVMREHVFIGAKPVDSILHGCLRDEDPILR
jgi:RimJ/RimL family protein N-acetyltransferase